MLNPKHLPPEILSALRESLNPERGLTEEEFLDLASALSARDALDLYLNHIGIREMTNTIILALFAIDKAVVAEATPEPSRIPLPEPC